MKRLVEWLHTPHTKKPDVLLIVTLVLLTTALIQIVKGLLA